MQQLQQRAEESPADALWAPVLLSMPLLDRTVGPCCRGSHRRAPAVAAPAALLGGGSAGTWPMGVLLSGSIYLRCIAGCSLPPCFQCGSLRAGEGLGLLVCFSTCKCEIMTQI